MAESLNSFDSGLDQGSAFGIEPELVYERLQTTTHSLSRRAVISETQATAALLCRGRFASPSVGLSPEFTLKIKFANVKSAWECFCSIGLMHSRPYFCFTTVWVDARQQDCIKSVAHHIKENRLCHESCHCSLISSIQMDKLNWKRKQKPKLSGGRRRIKSQSGQVEGEEEKAKVVR